MPKPNSRQLMRHQDATESDLHQILGDMDDSTALAILALHPSVAQLEEARGLAQRRRRCPRQRTSPA